VMFCTVQLESVNISGSGVSDADVCVCGMRTVCLQSLKFMVMEKWLK
jgi:hypothetical protein